MHRIIALVALIFSGFIVWIISEANSGNQNDIFRVVQSLPYGDKIGHFCLFGALNFLAIPALRWRRLQLGPVSVYWGCAIVSTLVLLEEVSQLANAHRTFDLIDLTADATGIALSTLLALILEKYFRPPPSTSTVNHVERG